jgi:hypothetical protein
LTLLENQLNIWTVQSIPFLFKRERFAKQIRCHSGFSLAFSSAFESDIEELLIQTPLADRIEAIP